MERTAGGGGGFGELRDLFGGEGSRSGRRRVTVQPARLQPTGTETAQEQSAGPRDNQMDFLGIRGDWQSSMQFRKPLSYPKLCLQARICLQGHNEQRGELFMKLFHFHSV